jgi:putative tricarboxylic transport membrane protein
MLETLAFATKLLDPHIMMILVLGALGGIFLGAVPGISPTMAVALLVPVTFYMEPAAGLILLGVIYTCTVTGGAITAILINVPGAPANIATCLDGYPMAKQGRSCEAMCATFVLSAIGGIAGVMALIWFTPILAAFAMKFGPSELFWVTIFGVTVIAGLSSGNVLKGLFAGFFGMLISCIGFSPMLGEPRFVFHNALTAGIVIVPAIIGMFAIPQILTTAEDLPKLSGAKVRKEITEIMSKAQRQRGVLWSVFTRLGGWWKILTTGSIVGLIIGVTPGAGANVASLIAYDYAKKMSKNPDSYGKGNPDAVVASEITNSTTVGPALVSTLTLGVPGSPTAAALMGGLLIHGLFPGPDLFTKHIDITRTFLVGLLAAQFLMLPAGLALARFSQHIMKVPALLMMVIISVLAVVGGFGVQNSMDDVYIMLALGFMVYFGGKLGFPAAPAVLGVVLGPIAETNFLRGKLIAQTDVGVFNYFFTGTVNMVIIAICIASITWGVFMEWRTYKAAKARKEASA